MLEPWRPDHVRRLLRILLGAGGEIRFSRHALDEMRQDYLTTVDCANVLRAGVLEPGELVSGTWRYRVRTSRICVVIAFRSERECLVVTAWRFVR